MDKSKPWRAFAASEEDEIMIAGMAGRFPECDNVDELAHNLYNKVGDCLIFDQTVSLK